MLTDKMRMVALNIQHQIITVFPLEYVQETFSGKITLKDVVDQILVECCKRSYDVTQPVHSLDFYLGGAASVDDSERMLHQRTMDYIREKKKIQNDNLLSKGWYVEGLVPKDLKDIKDKLKGHKLNKFQFWEIRNVHDMPLVKAIVDKRIGKGNFTAIKMQEYSDDYDSFLKRCNEDWSGDQANKLFDFLAMFTLEWKYSFDFYYEVVDRAVDTGITRLSDIQNRVGLFTAPLNLYSDLTITNPQIVPGPIAVDNRMLTARRKYLEDIISLDTGSEKFAAIKRQWMGSQVIIGAMLTRMTLSGVPIIQWFRDNSNEADWFSVFEEYDVFQAFVTDKAWNKKKTRIVKDIYNEMSFDYKNHEKRS